MDGPTSPRQPDNMLLSAFASPKRSGMLSERHGHQLAEQMFTTGGTAQCLQRHMDAVVKVLCVHSKPNFELPWQRRQQYSSKSTGFAVATPNGERWLLTNAHSVSYATQVQLKRRADDEKYTATVLAVGTECDIALLTVEDDAFWEGLVPLELGELPALQDPVAVIDSLAISAGVVSRVQMTHYSHGCMSLLAVQTDAAINSGNSGGPVMAANGRCIGIAFQSLTGDTQSVGYVIPTSVVRHFLEDVVRHGQDGQPRYSGFPSLNLIWQELDSKAGGVQWRGAECSSGRGGAGALKSAYGLGPHQKGVLVRSVAPASNEAEVLRPDDVVAKIDGVQLGSDGTVPFRHGERVDFKFLVTQRFIGDTIRLDLLRGGQPLAVEFPLKKYQARPRGRAAGTASAPAGGWRRATGGARKARGAANDAPQRPPPTDPYLVQRYGTLSASPVRLMFKTWFGVKEHPDQQVVVLSNVLACAATTGYESTLGLKDSAVTAFNGVRIRNLAHLAFMVQRCEEPFYRFDLEAANKVVVLDAAAARACTAALLEEHSISEPMSRDIKEAAEAWEEPASDNGAVGAAEASAGARAASSATAAATASA
eukprot:scaffold11.g3950.t1